MQAKKSESNVKSYKLPTNRAVLKATPTLATSPSDYITLKEAYSAVRQVRGTRNDASELQLPIHKKKSFETSFDVPQTTMRRKAPSFASLSRNQKDLLAASQAQQFQSQASATFNVNFLAIDPDSSQRSLPDIAKDETEGTFDEHPQCGTFLTADLLTLSQSRGSVQLQKKPNDLPSASFRG